MLTDKLFALALAASVCGHGFILAQHLDFNLLTQEDKQKKIEVHYVNKASINLEPDQFKPKAPLRKQEPFFKLPLNINTSKINPPPFIEQQQNVMMAKQIARKGPAFIKPALAKSDASLKLRISLPALGLNKTSSPSYIAYYQIVREKIRRAAYQNYSNNETGQVYLSFVVSSSGRVSEVRLIEEKTSFSPYLRDIALRSVYDASPFPNFPKELDYPQLSFNVVISFEIE